MTEAEQAAHDAAYAKQQERIREKYAAIGIGAGAPPAEAREVVDAALKAVDECQRVIAKAGEPFADPMKRAVVVKIAFNELVEVAKAYNQELFDLLMAQSIKDYFK